MKNLMMKLYGWLTICGFLLACAAQQAHAGVDVDLDPYVSWPLENTVFVHKKASTSSSIIEIINKDDTVTVVGKNGGWKKIRLSSGKNSGQIGYSESSSLRPKMESPSPQRVPVNIPVDIDQGYRNVTDYIATVTASNLFVREGPGKRYQEYSQLLPRGEPVRVTHEKSGNEYVKISFRDGLPAYVSSEHLERAPDRTPGVVSDVPDAARQASASFDVDLDPYISWPIENTVFVHQEASASSSIIEIIDTDDTVTVVGKNGGWLRIRLSSGNNSGEVGYAESSSLRPKLDSPSQSVPIHVDYGYRNVTDYIATVTASNLWVREGPGREYKEYPQLLPRGEPVRVTHEKSGNVFVKISFRDGLPAYVSSEYLERVPDRTPGVVTAENTPTEYNYSAPALQANQNYEGELGSMLVHPYLAGTIGLCVAASGGAGIGGMASLCSTIDLDKNIGAVTTYGLGTYYGLGGGGTFGLFLGNANNEYLAGQGLCSGVSVTVGALGGIELEGAVCAGLVLSDNNGVWEPTGVHSAYLGAGAGYGTPSFTIDMDTWTEVEEADLRVLFNPSTLRAAANDVVTDIFFESIVRRAAEKFGPRSVRELVGSTFDRFGI